MTMLQVIIFVVIIMSVAGMTGAIYHNNVSTRRQRAFDVIRGGVAVDNSVNEDGEDRDRRRATMARKLKENQAAEGNERRSRSKELIAQAGLEWSRARYWITAFITSFVTMIILFALGMSVLVVLMGGVTGLVGLPRFYLKRRAAKRQKAFLQDFADALEAMQRLLKAGMPVTEAVAMVGREFTGPVGEEMSKIYEAQKIGTSMPDATMEAAKRMPLTEMNMFATGIAIQTQTGSSLSEVLSNLANVIRARHRLKRKVKALSSEAKSSAMIIAALPIFVAGGMYLVNRAYFNLLIEHPVGQFMLGGAVTWMLIGVIVMKQMINFKV